VCPKGRGEARELRAGLDQQAVELSGAGSGSLTRKAFFVCCQNLSMVFGVQAGKTTRTADRRMEIRLNFQRYPCSGTLGWRRFQQFDIGGLMIGIRCIGVDEQVRDDIARAAFGAFGHHKISPWLCLIIFPLFACALFLKRILDLQVRNFVQ